MIKLSLGCAQFGMNYGFTNERGKVDEDEVKKIIDYAIANDIKNFDTAQSYGNSEEVLGKFIKNYSYFHTKYNPVFCFKTNFININSSFF